MAKLMSIAVTIFMAAPILAPAFGQAILLIAPWRAIFFSLMLYGLVVFAWVQWRLPETLPPEGRKSLNLQSSIAAYREFLFDRCAAGYTIASALCFGALFGYISASEQLFLEVYELGDKFSLVFALIAAALGAATLVNSQLVERHGMRKITHAALILFLCINLAHMAFASLWGSNVYSFIGFVAPAFFAIGLIGPNASALSLERMGHIAGSAAAANGFAGTTIAGFLGGVVGRQFDGTAMPIIQGFAILSAAALALVIWVEKGKLFRPGESVAEPPMSTAAAASEEGPHKANDVEGAQK